MNIDIDEAKRKEIAGHLRAAADFAEAGNVSGMLGGVLNGLRVVVAEADERSRRLGFNLRGILRGYVQKGVDQIFGGG